MYRKSIHTYFRPKRAQLLCKISILTSNQLSGERYSNVIALLCAAKSQRVQSLMGTLAWTDSYCKLDRNGSRTSVASRMKFFVTTVNGWQSLAVVTKKAILAPAAVLGPPLLEIEMSKRSKHHTNGREFY